MTRTEESFAKAIEEVKSFTVLHDKAVWLVPTDSSYEVSVIEPSPEDLPAGTRANLYDPELAIISFVVSSNHH